MAGQANQGQLIGSGRVRMPAQFRLTNVTTTERTALALTLGTGDKGVLVYDSTLNSVWCWTGAAFASVGAMT